MKYTVNALFGNYCGHSYNFRMMREKYGFIKNLLMTLNSTCTVTCIPLIGSTALRCSVVTPSNGSSDPRQCCSLAAAMHCVSGRWVREVNTHSTSVQSNCCSR